MTEREWDLSQTAAALQEIVRHWRQGDCVLGDHYFAWRFSPSRPLTQDAQEALAYEGDSDLAERSERGFVIVTQTCDIVRDPTSRPWIEICPLVELSTDDMESARKGTSSRYALVPGVEPLSLAADIDRSMTVEKSVLLDWERVPGCKSDSEARAFARTLARKRARFAFPDDFVRGVEKLRKRVIGKHSKESDEGQAVRSLREIRVRAAPSWTDANIEIFFWFIREDDSPDVIGSKSWDQWVDGWIQLVNLAIPYGKPERVAVHLERMTAKDYVESDPLELDHLSSVLDEDDA